MKKIALSFLSFLSILFMPFMSMAHPGHGDSDGFTIIHYLVEPIHAIATISLIFIVAFAYYIIIRNKKQEIKAK